MKKYDNFIITDELILTRTKNGQWQTFNYKDYYPYDISDIETDIFADNKHFESVIMDIKRKMMRPILSRMFIKKYALIMNCIDMSSEQRVSLLGDYFCINLRYSEICFSEVGLLVAAASEINDSYQPVIVISKVGNCIELSFCFAGTKIINCYCRRNFINEFDKFYNECLKKREQTLSLIMDVSCFPPDFLKVMNKTWDEGVDFKIIMASNNLKFDQELANLVPIDIYEDFTKVTDAIPKLLNLTFKQKLSSWLK